MRLADMDVETSRWFSSAFGTMVALLAAAVVALSLSPTSADAVVARIHGHAYGLTPVRGVRAAGLPSVKRALRASGASTAPVPYDKSGQLVNHGGPVMHSVTTHVIYWDPNGEFSGTTTGIFQKFFTDVAHDSGSPSNVFGVAGQYTDATGNAAYSSTFAGEKVDKDPYPSTGNCKTPKGQFADPGPYSTCLFDEQLQNELLTYIENEALPTGPTQLYFLLLPHKVVSCFEEEDPELEEEACSNNVFCAYHSAIELGPSEEILYADIPFSLLDSSDAKGCQFDLNSAIQHPNGDATGTNETTRYADVALKYTSHEYIEAATDPLGTAWWDFNGEEIGDKCNFAGSGPNPGEDPNAFLPTLGGSATSGTLFNQSIGLDSFYLQSEWDNAGKACLMKPLALSAAKFTSSPASGEVGVPVKFSGAASDPYGGLGFTWKFGDGTEGSGAKPEHAYSAAGSYNVTMTATDRFTGSTTAPVVHTVTVDELPVAAFTSEPNPAEVGQAVKFNGAASSDSDGTITGYAWKFGDGSAGTGEAPEHTYTASGSYTVTLTVTDSASQKATITHGVTVKGLPTVVTGAASALGPGSATLNATVNPNGTSTECKFEYGPTSTYVSTVPCASAPGSGTSPVAVSASITGLSANTQYHFRIVAKDTGGTADGADQTFTTTSNPPTAVTEPASSVTQSTATLNGTVNPNGGSAECRFEYGPTSSYGASASCATSPGSGSTAVAVSASLASLAANTTYHFRIVAQNTGGTAEGADQTFTTTSNPPTAVTEPASSVTQTTATLNGTVNPNGGNVGECRFEYGPTSSYGASASCATSPGSGTVAMGVSASVASLAADTTYHFRIVAKSTSGAADGADQVFTTRPNVVVETLVASFTPQGPFSPQPPVTSQPSTPIPNSAFRAPSTALNAKTGAMTFTTSVADPGTFSWLITFQNGKFGVFAASAAKCKKGLVRLNGRCRPATVVFAKGSRLVTAGSVSFTVRPSGSAAKALKNALKRHGSLPLSAAFTFQSSHGGNPVSHNQVMFDRLKQ